MNSTCTCTQDDLLNEVEKAALLDSGPEGSVRHVLENWKDEHEQFGRIFLSLQLDTQSVLMGIFDLRCLERQVQKEDVNLFWNFFQEKKSLYKDTLTLWIITTKGCTADAGLLAAAHNIRTHTITPHPEDATRFVLRYPVPYREVILPPANTLQSNVTFLQGGYDDEDYILDPHRQKLCTMRNIRAVLPLIDDAATLEYGTHIPPRLTGAQSLSFTLELPGHFILSHGTEPVEIGGITQEYKIGLSELEGATLPEVIGKFLFEQVVEFGGEM